MDAQKRANSVAQARAASKAASLVTLGKQASDDHPYLVRKRVSAAAGLLELPAAAVFDQLQWWPHAGGERLVGRLLIMPLRDASGSVSSIEFIDENGKKSALVKGKKAGRFFVIGSLPQIDSFGTVLYFAEGYATAASLHRALAGCVLVCSSVGNFGEVIAEARRRWTRARCVVCGDRDTGPSSRSEVRAREAAKAGRAACVFAEFGEPPSSGKNDFNDMANSLGDEKIRQHISAAIAEQSVGPDLSILDRKWSPISPPTQLIAPDGGRLGVFAPEVTRWIDDEARGRSSPTDFVFGGLLTTCAGVIGSKRRAQLRPSWNEPCILWAA